MITTRGTRSPNGSVEDEIEIPVDLEKGEIEAPRSSSSPKEEISINVSIFFGALLYLIFMCLALMWNADHFHGFYFGRLT